MGIRIGHRVLVAATVLLLAGVGTAAAGDHLSCYKVRDRSPGSPARDQYTADLISSLTSQLDQYDCKIRTPAKYCCAPVDKVGIPPNPPPPGTPGAETGKFCCYKVKCQITLTNPMVLEFEDQFGSRTLYVDKESLLCAPAS